MELHNCIPIWNQLSFAEQQELEASSALRTVPKGTLLHNGGADCLGLLLICSGQLRVFITSDEGREITLYRLFERDMCLFSASCMLNSIQFDVMISAEKDTTFHLIPADVYRSLMDRSAVLANYTNELMASRFSDVMWLMEQILWKSIDRRLAAFLLEESVIENSLTLKLTHDAVAAHIGSAREVVTRMLRYFQSEEMVRLSRGTITLTDLEKLRRLTE